MQAISFEIYLGKWPIQLAHFYFQMPRDPKHALEFIIFQDCEGSTSFSYIVKILTVHMLTLKWGILS